MNILFSIIGVAHAHEQGAASVTFDNTLGPILAFAIIILAIVVAKRIKSRQNLISNRTKR